MKLPYSGYLQPPCGPLLLYYITDRRQFRGSPEQQKQKLLDKIAECIAAGIDLIQLREKDLSIHALEGLAKKTAGLFAGQSRSKLLINSRIDVALACGAHGVHLPSNDISASEARTIFARAGRTQALIGASVHSVEELAQTQAHAADFAVFGPVFQKQAHAIADGVQRLQEACHKADRCMPVLALGGITAENAQECLAAGADGIATIRLFQENDVRRVVAQLRHLTWR